MGRHSVSGFKGRTVRLPSGRLALVVADQGGELDVKTISGHPSEFSIRSRHVSIYDQRVALGLTDRPWRSAVD